jgi:thiol-disulfide isomerase/thioredoxin
MGKAGLIGVLLFLAGAMEPAGAELPAAFGPVDAKVVWVDFWASWCAPCRRSFPWMNAMYEKYASEGLQIIAVNVDKERALADEFLEETPAEFRLHFDPSGQLAETFGVQAMPSSFVLDASGNVLATHYGFKLADTAQYEQAIRAALDNAAPGRPTEQQ